MVLHGRRNYLLIVFVVLVCSRAWATNNYQTKFINTYCYPGATCAVYWPMDETTGTTLHNQCGATCGLATPSSYNLTTHNTPLLNQTGAGSAPARGTSVNFVAASSQYAEVMNNGTGAGPGDGSTLGGMSAGCWANFGTSAASTLSLESINTGSITANAFDRIWQIYIDSSKMGFAVYRNSGAGNGVFQNTVGVSTISNNTWYYLASFWSATCSGGTCSASTSKIYLNGTQEGSTNTTFSGAAPDAQTWLQLAALTVPTATPITYLNGNLQDCYIIHGFIDPPTVYNLSVGVSPDWPYNVKLDIPKRRDGGWIEKVVDRGYVTGHFTNLAKRPLLFGPYPNFGVLPPGNVR